MEHSYKTEFGRRYEAYEQSKEMEAYRNLNALQSSFQVFNMNFCELMKWLEPLKDSRESLCIYSRLQIYEVQ
jgi:hypothetical protein